MKNLRVSISKEVFLLSIILIVFLALVFHAHEGLIYKEEQKQITIRHMVDAGYSPIDARCTFLYLENLQEAGVFETMELQ